MKFTPLFIVLFYLACNKSSPKSVETVKSNLTLLADAPSVSVTNDVPTLSQNGNKFRVTYSSKEESELYVEKLNGGLWSRILSTDQSRYGDTLVDFNKDGFLDLIVHRKWQDEVFIFNSKTNIFESIGEFGTELQPIVGTKDVYFDETSWKDGSLTSNLIRIAVGKVHILAHLQAFQSEDLNDYTFTVTKDKKKVDSFRHMDADVELLSSYWTKNWNKY
jgi:hypothetical protein